MGEPPSACGISPREAGGEGKRRLRAGLRGRSNGSRSATRIVQPSPYVTIRRTISYVSSTPMCRFSIDMCSSFPWKPDASAGVSSTGMKP